jgi:hypothetical protein
MMLSLDTAQGIKKAIGLLNQVEEVTDQILAARRMVIRRARVLNCSSLIPTEWRKMPILASASEVESPAHERVIGAKSDLSGIDQDDLRRAYLEGVREYAMLPVEKRPPFSRDTYAQAKVNTYISNVEVQA